MYQIIDDPDSDKLFLVMQLGDLGQLMKWDEDLLKYHINMDIYNFTKTKIGIQQNLEPKKEREYIAKYIFKEIGEGINYLHNLKLISHRDIKLDNIICKSEGNNHYY